MELINARTGKKDRLGHLYVMMGKEATDVKSREGRRHHRGSQAHRYACRRHAVAIGRRCPSIRCRCLCRNTPLPSRRLNKKEEDKVGTFLARAVENDPTLRVARNEQTHQTIVTAMGEAQVETLLARMKEQAKVEARLVPVRIPYRETITQDGRGAGASQEADRRRRPVR